MTEAREAVIRNGTSRDYHGCALIGHGQLFYLKGWLLFQLLTTLAFLLPTSLSRD